MKFKKNENDWIVKIHSNYSKRQSDQLFQSNEFLCQSSKRDKLIPSSLPTMICWATKNNQTTSRERYGQTAANLDCPAIVQFVQRSHSRFHQKIGSFLVDWSESLSWYDLRFRRNRTAERRCFVKNKTPKLSINEIVSPSV